MKKSLILLGALLAVAAFPGCDAKSTAPAPDNAVEDKAPAVATEEATPAAAVVAEDKAPAPDATPSVDTPVDVWSSLPDVVAKVDGKDILKKDFVESVMSKMPGGQLPAMASPELIELLAPQWVTQFVLQPLMVAEAEKAGFKPSADRIRELFKADLARMSADEQENLKKELVAQGQTIEGIIESNATNVDVQQQVAITEFMEKEIIAKIVIPGEEVKKFYDENPDAFTRYDVAHILVEVAEDASEDARAEAKKKAEEILAKVKAASDKFADFAKESSDCPSKEDGGQLPPFNKGQMVPEFEEVVFAMKDGDISEVFPTQFGYHIAKLNKVNKIPFDEVKEQIASMLKNQKSNAAMEQFMEKVKTDHKVEILIQPKLQMLQMPQQ